MRQRKRDSRPIAALKNLGPVTAKWLAAIGVLTAGDLARLGAPLAYRLVKEREPKCSRNLLWGLAAALRGIDWRQLEPSEKAHLLRAAEAEE